MEATSTTQRSRSAGSAAASAGPHGGPGHGDDAVRDALAGVNTGAIVWLLSRAISYMDESGFPEAVAPWFPDEEPGGLAISAPEDEEERRQRRRGEVWREGDSPALLTADDGRPGAESASNVLASLDQLVFSEDASVDCPTETFEEGTGGRVGPIAPLGRIAREDPLVMTPELHEDVSMAGTWRKTSESRAAEMGWLSPSVRTTTTRLRAFGVK